MDIVKELLKNMDDESKNSVFLREIALLMEEIDNLCLLYTSPSPRDS